jgi:serine/threonine-protein kinase
MATIGDQFAGRYRLDAQIGSGGFAAVFRARDLRLERDVALKVLLATQASDAAIAARFDREARVLAAVSHPNVVAIHDVGPEDPASGDPPFLVMELCEGGSLADRLTASETGRLAPDELIPILVDVTGGLAALHAQGIVHRDVKPSNILLSDGWARIADLGIATLGQSELTVPGTTIGTLAYLAPEQIAGGAASAASDVYALGTVAFRGLTGRLPGSADGSGLVSQVEPSVGGAFDAAIAQALAPDPLRRPTAAEFGLALGAALERWLITPASAAASDETTVITVPVPGDVVAPAEALVEPPRRGRVLLAGGAFVLILLLLALTAFLVFRPEPSDGVATPQATPSLGPSPTVGVSPSPSATVDPFSDARAASDEMRAAIADARGADGLNGREARDLESVLDQFDRALDDNDVTTARDAANELDRQVTELIDQGAVDAAGAARLADAADALVAAANALPD